MKCRKRRRLRLSRRRPSKTEVKLPRTKKPLPSKRRKTGKAKRHRMAEERLQKILANSGVASRRKAEELIVAGRVSVNGRTVVELGSKADVAKDEVKVDGKRLHAPAHHVYYAFHKPKNVITTVSDPERRETVMSYFKGLRERIYPVGRLDYAS